MKSRSPPLPPGLITLLFARVRLFFARRSAPLWNRVRTWRRRFWDRLLAARGGRLPPT
ncbi:hypothetical protein FHR71_001188 [Methylobacterium sp. RAS18]|nr:hypothetical protein [Methylobacterium sp. RAS18]